MVVGIDFVKNAFSIGRKELLPVHVVDSNFSDLGVRTAVLSCC